MSTKKNVKKRALSRKILIKYWTETLFENMK